MPTQNSADYVTIRKFNPEGYYVVEDSNTAVRNKLGFNPNHILYHNPTSQEFVITKKMGIQRDEIVLWRCGWFEEGMSYEYALELALEKIRGLSEHLG